MYATFQRLDDDRARLYNDCNNFTTILYGSTDPPYRYVTWIVEIAAVVAAAGENTVNAER